METKQIENKAKPKNQIPITVAVLVVVTGLMALSIIPLQAYAVKCEDCSKDDCLNPDYGDGSCGGQPPTPCNPSPTKVCGYGIWP
jgi:hypothetical protein